jgi:ribonucleoside-diphosphate reductase alpha subunit
MMSSFTMNTDMQVKKRDETLQEMSFDKILGRIKTLGSFGEAPLDINSSELAIKVIEQLYDGIETTQIDELTAEQCASLSTQHPDYGILAGRIVISNNHKNVGKSFVKAMNQLYNFTDIHGVHHPIVSKEFIDVVEKYADIIETNIDYSRDYELDYFGYKTLERAYLMRVNKKIIERPQHMWMRVSIGIHFNDIHAAIETYNYMSQKYFTHATPTLFNAGTPRPQMSSCYLLAMEDDSIRGIYNTLGDCAKISKWAGGIGIHIHNIRAKGSHIRGTNGTSNGIVPMLRVFNNTARYVDQGGGRRNGSFAMYIEPWHKDIMDFLDMKKNHGDEEMRARDLFYAIWMCDLFMERVQSDANWTLMCPDECPGLSDVYGDDFKSLYEKYEQEGKGTPLKARNVWFKIMESQIETGTPYIVYKDSVNKKTNQKNIGTIKSSNLCSEIAEYSDKDETAVCNLASIALPNFVRDNVDRNAKYVIYSKEHCNYCVLSKGLLKRSNVDYRIVDLTDDEKREEHFKEWNGEREELGMKPLTTMPQIWKHVEEEDGRKTRIYIGGYSELMDEFRPLFDYAHLEKVASIVTRNLNKVIDLNFYPTDKTERSNLRHRPIGIGIQGLADAIVKMGYSFDDENARELNRTIFETIYYGSVKTSIELARERQKDMMILSTGLGTKWTFKYSNTDENKLYDHLCEYNVLDESVRHLLYKVRPKRCEYNNLTPDTCGAYSSFVGSPASKGILQFDMWNEHLGTDISLQYDWSPIKEDLKKYGMRNSLLIAPMPTASTSQILGNNECFEPFTSNIYLRRTLAGEFVIINKYLIRELISCGLWNREIKNRIISNDGSVQGLSEIPRDIQHRYKIVWEMSMKHIIDMARDRGYFVCQSQSMNLWMESPDYQKLTMMHFYGWKQGLKTGIYYLRTKAKAAAQKFTIEPGKPPKPQEKDDGECLMCSA